MKFTSFLRLSRNDSDITNFCIGFFVLKICITSCKYKNKNETEKDKFGDIPPKKHLNLVRFQITLT